jgi:DNA-binding IclR family transcriptional regulator
VSRMAPPVSSGSPAGPSPLRSVAIAFSILDCFLASPELGPTAVARQVGIAKSTASRMLAVMAERGVLERLDGGRYQLGLRLFDYGQLAVTRLRIFEVSVPILAGLRDRVRDLVQLGIPVGAEILFLDRYEAEGLDPRFHGQIWRRVPAHSSSSGRAIAAFNPDVERAIFDAGLSRYTRYTVVDPQRLTRVLSEVRRRGFASTDEERVEGISSVAVPVRVTTEHGSRAVAAVSVAGPSRRLHRDGIPAIARHATEAAGQIAELLHGPTP